MHDEAGRGESVVLSESEERAKVVVDSVLNRTLLDWDTQGRQAVVDLRDTSPPELSVEVKRWTCEAYQAGMHQWQSVKGWHPQPDLVHRWLLVIEIPTTGSSNTRLPKFATLLEDVQHLIRDMLQAGIHSDRDLSTRRFDPTIASLFDRWQQTLPGGGSLRSHPVFSSVDTPAEHKRPGLDVASSSSSVGSADPDSLPHELNDWLTMEGPAENLISKLQSSGDPHNHGYLVLDQSHDSWWMLDHWGTAGLPTAPVDLPDRIQRIWVSGYGEIVWWYDRETGWGSTTVGFAQS